MFKMNSFGLAKSLALYMALPGTALVIYFLWKQNKDNEEVIKSDSLVSRQSVNEMKIPADCVGAIIGTEGSTIKEIQKNTNTRIIFKRQEDNEEIRTIVIRGTSVNVQKAELEIKRLIAEKPIIISDTLEVPQDVCGKIIGKNGANINLMRRMSGCKINISKEPIKNIENIFISVVTITGTLDQISQAKELIIEKLKEDDAQKRRKLSNQSIKNSVSINNMKVAQQNVDEYSVERFSSQKPDSCEFPFDDSEITVFVSAVANPNAFWVHIVNDETVKLDKLVDDMQEFYEKNINDKKLFVTDFRVGSVVAARFNGSGWYRGEIKGIITRDELKSDKNNNTSTDETNGTTNTNTNNNDDELIDLYYIDFGDSAYVEKSIMRKLLTEFSELQCQAVHCCLNDVEPVNAAEGWTEQAITCFEDITYSCQWKELKSKLVFFKDNEDERPTPLIDLYDSTQDVDIAETLIQYGLAIRTSEKNNRIAHKF